MKRFILSIAIGLSLCAGCAAQSPTKVSILGDSYSTFEGCVTPYYNVVWYYLNHKPEETDVTDVSQTWWSLLLDNEDLNLQLEKNNSFSGATICTTGYDAEDFSDRAFLTRMTNLGDPDLILIFGATNDSWCGAPIGDFKWDGWTANDLKSFRPALAYMLHNIKALYPDSRFLYIINDGLKPEISSSIIEACERYAVPYIELDGIDKTAGHPNIHGMQQIAHQIASRLKN